MKKIIARFLSALISLNDPNQPQLEPPLSPVDKEGYTVLVQAHLVLVWVMLKDTWCPSQLQMWLCEVMEPLDLQRGFTWALFYHHGHTQQPLDWPDFDLTSHPYIFFWSGLWVSPHYRLWVSPAHLSPALQDMAWPLTYWLCTPLGS